MANSSAVSRAMRSSGSAAAYELCEFCEGAVFSGRRRVDVVAKPIEDVLNGGADRVGPVAEGVCGGEAAELLRVPRRGASWRGSSYGELLVRGARR